MRLFTQPPPPPPRGKSPIGPVGLQAGLPGPNLGFRSPTGPPSSVQRQQHPLAVQNQTASPPQQAKHPLAAQTRGPSQQQPILVPQQQHPIAGSPQQHPHGFGSPQQQHMVGSPQQLGASPIHQLLAGSPQQQSFAAFLQHQALLHQHQQSMLGNLGQGHPGGQRHPSGHQDGFGQLNQAGGQHGGQGNMFGGLGMLPPHPGQQQQRHSAERQLPPNDRARRESGGPGFDLSAFAAAASGVSAKKPPPPTAAISLADLERSMFDDVKETTPAPAQKEGNPPPGFSRPGLGSPIHPFVEQQLNLLHHLQQMNAAGVHQMNAAAGVHQMSPGVPQPNQMMLPFLPVGIPMDPRLRPIGPMGQGMFGPVMGAPGGMVMADAPPLPMCALPGLAHHQQHPVQQQQLAHQQQQQAAQQPQQYLPQVVKLVYFINALSCGDENHKLQYATFGLIQ